MATEICVFYTMPSGEGLHRKFDDWLSAIRFTNALRGGGCTDIRIIQGENVAKWDSLMLDAAHLIYNDGLSPMMAIAHILYNRGLTSNAAAAVLSEVTGKEVRPSCARDYMRRANEKITDRPK